MVVKLCFKITLSNLHLSMYYYYYILYFYCLFLYLYPYIFDLFYILWPFVVPVVNYMNMKINENENEKYVVS